MPQDIVLIFVDRDHDALLIDHVLLVQQHVLIVLAINLVVELLGQHIHVHVISGAGIARILPRMMFAVAGASAEQELIRQIVVQPNDGIVGQERELLAVRMIPDVLPVLKIGIHIEAAA